MVDTNRYNTGNELGSNKLEDLSDNAKNIDNFANGGNESFHDRFGVVRKSIAGMESDHVDQINAHEIEHDNQISAHETEHDNQIARHESEFITHIEGMGWTPAAGSFQVGGTITDRNQTLYDEVSHVFYAWGGTLPKVVAAGSTPATSGGIGVDAWSDKTDLMLRGDLSGLMTGNSYLSDFTEGATSTDDLVSAISHALAGGKELVIDADFSVNGTLLPKTLTQVKFTGNKSLNGPYRKKVVDEFRAPFVPVNTINPLVHLKNLAATDSPVVVMMGDSISTEGPNSLTLADSMWSICKEKLISDNPQKSFTFHNRGIGGQTWLHANSKPTAFPYWYTVISTPWLDYIQSLSPDVVFLAFGMNDANGFNSGAVVAVVNKIKAWSKVPDIIFITNPVPAQTTIFPDGKGFGFVGQTFQEGRDYAAEWVRCYARVNGYGIIDINRTMVAMRDCYDVTSGIMEKVETVSASNYTAAAAANCFSFRCSVSASAWEDGKILAVKCGLGNTDFIFIKNVSGVFVVEGFSAGVSTYKSIATGVTVPAVEFGIEVSIVGGMCRVIFDPTDTTFATAKRVIAEFSVIRHGGIFLPMISWQGKSDGPFSSIQYSSGYFAAKYEQSVTDSDVWGTSDLTADTKEPFGGNGINHYSAKGIALVVRPTIEACQLGVDATTSGIHAKSGGRWVKFSNGLSVFQKTVTWTGDASISLGSIFMSSDFADTSFPTEIFKSDGASGYEFSQSVSLSSAFGGLWVVSSSTMKNAIRYRIGSAIARTGISVTVNITLIGRWK